MKPAITALRDLCKARFEAFGTAGQASRIKPIPLATMAKNYASGSLDPVFAVAHAA
jgi:fructose-bisphosphate aldolase class II